jgi:phosphatidylserine/phosphatidylglycerophosphate/cardiolipin synthase-like enzyme
MTANPEDWLLTARERGNPATSLDDRHADKAAWSKGNEVRPLVHGAVYFAELLAEVNELQAGDSLLFTDWRGDPDELLAGAGSEVAHVLCAAARRGVLVKGLVWRSHLDRLQFSSQENRHLGEDIEAAGGECLLDMRVRPGGSHHQKFVVLRHPGHPELDVAYIGGIDLCHGRHDDAGHAGDPQAQPMAAVYGGRPPWHDLQVAIRGPAVGDVEAIFRERWQDPAPLSRSARSCNTRTPTPTRCRPNCRIQRRGARTPCNCSAPIPSADGATSSPRTGSAASRAATSKCCAEPDP